MQRAAQAMQKLPHEMARANKSAITEALLLLEREIKDDMPVGATNTLKGSITHALRGTPVDLSGKVFTPINYAMSVELGTKPHFPPIDPLTDWVKAKFDIQGAEARSVAFLIARKIAKKGTKGAHTFTNTLSAQSSQVLRILESAVDRVYGS